MENENIERTLLEQDILIEKVKNLTDEQIIRRKQEGKKGYQNIDFLPNGDIRILIKDPRNLDTWKRIPKEERRNFIEKREKEKEAFDKLHEKFAEYIKALTEKQLKIFNKLIDTNKIKFTEKIGKGLYGDEVIYLIFHKDLPRFIFDYEIRYLWEFAKEDIKKEGIQKQLIKAPADFEGMLYPSSKPQNILRMKKQVGTLKQQETLRNITGVQKGEPSFLTPERIKVEYTKKDHYRALMCVQTLLAKTDFIGNLPPKLIRDAFFSNDIIEIPRYYLNQENFLDYYGVEKEVSKRGILEYSDYVKMRAMRSIIEIGFIPQELVYKSYGNAVFSKNIPLIEIVKGWGILTEKQIKKYKIDKLILSEKKDLKGIIIEPCHALIFNTKRDSRWLLKDSQLFRKIDNVSPGISVACYKFLGWLNYIAWGKTYHKQYPSLEIETERLLIVLGLEKYKEKKLGLKTHIFPLLNKIYKVALELRYLQEKPKRRTKKGKTFEILKLNLETFPHRKPKEK